MMSRCNPKKFIENDEGDLWCKACWNTQLHNEVDLPTRLRHKCRFVHLAENTVEKIDGDYCSPCSKEYEQKLLSEFAKKGDSECVKQSC